VSPAVIEEDLRAFTRTVWGDRGQAKIDPYLKGSDLFLHKKVDRVNLKKEGIKFKGGGDQGGPSAWHAKKDSTVGKLHGKKKVPWFRKDFYLNRDGRRALSRQYENRLVGLPGTYRAKKSPRTVYRHRKKRIHSAQSLVSTSDTSSEKTKKNHGSGDL